MTSATWDEGPALPPSAGRLGALAAVTPIAMFGAWIGFSGWVDPAGEVAVAVTAIAFGAAIAGWIVGGRIGRSIPKGLGFVVYPVVAWFVLLPINVAGGTLVDLHAGRLVDAIGVLVAATGYLLYGLVAGVYVFFFLLPFGAGWLVTFLILRRVLER